MERPGAPFLSVVHHYRHFHTWQLGGLSLCTARSLATTQFKKKDFYRRKLRQRWSSICEFKRCSHLGKFLASSVGLPTASLQGSDFEVFTIQTSKYAVNFRRISEGENTRKNSNNFWLPRWNSIKQLSISVLNDTHTLKCSRDSIQGNALRHMARRIRTCLFVSVGESHFIFPTFPCAQGLNSSTEVKLSVKEWVHKQHRNL